ncbi:breast carcinoma-amplified sequence 4 isoform X1 [Carettochelys insculpta]|uniref:breast carcinoma-amplified sequence 4 isoform X1 n=1 Tax=Carettochelys insculpta TaxID=44489 RepID=UPI003EBC96B3
MSAGGGREEGSAAVRLQRLLEPAEGSGAQRFALRLPPEPGEEVKEVEETIEEMLIRLDEFCGVTDVIRSDTSRILDETIPVIKAKVVEMNIIYAKVDKLEAFVKMVGHHVSFLEEQVLQAEREHNFVSHAVRRILQSAAIPSFKNAVFRQLRLVGPAGHGAMGRSAVDTELQDVQGDFSRAMHLACPCPPMTGHQHAAHPCFVEAGHTQQLPLWATNSTSGGPSSGMYFSGDVGHQHDLVVKACPHQLPQLFWGA